VEDAEVMLEAAERVGARIFVNFSNRGSPLDRATYYVIRQGLLGEIVYGDINLDDNIVVPTRMWGPRSKIWAAGSSPAHFLLSHVVDYLRWVLGAEVTEVYAITQRRVLGYTPDLLDQAHRRPGRILAVILRIGGNTHTYQAARVWRGGRVARKRKRSHDTQGSSGSPGTSVEGGHQCPCPAPPPRSHSRAGGGELKYGLEALTLPEDWWRVARGFIDSVLEDTLTPSSWASYGPLPTGIDGLRQTQVVCAIVDSAQHGRAVDVKA